MSLTWDFNPATIMLIAIQLIGFIVYIVRSQAESAAAKAAATAASDAASAATAAAQAVKDSLAAYKVEVAQTYASRETMAEALRPLLDEMHQLRDRIDKLIDRAVSPPQRRS